MCYRDGPWRTLDAVDLATLEWVRWLNTRRLMEPLGSLPPAEFEALYHAPQAISELAELELK